MGYRRYLQRAHYSVSFLYELTVWHEPLILPAFYSKTSAISSTDFTLGRRNFSPTQKANFVHARTPKTLQTIALRAIQPISAPVSETR